MIPARNPNPHPVGRHTDAHKFVLDHIAPIVDQTELLVQMLEAS